MKVPSSVVKFAAGNMDLFMQFRDYWNHWKNLNGNKNLEFATTDSNGQALSFDEKESLMNKALIKEVIRRSGIVYASEVSLEQWFNHPAVRYETFAIVSAMVDMILPESVIDTIGLYTDVRTIGWGDSASFTIKPRDLFVVSKAGHAQRSSEVRKQFNGQVTVIPEWHEITVSVSLYKVLSGAESLADFTAKAVRSIETRMTLDAYNCFATAMAALPSTSDTGLLNAGYTQAILTRICESVTAWNQGAKAIIAGTRLALANVLPTDANYRYTLDDPYAKLGYVPSAFGFDILMLPQVADITTPWGLALSNSALWIVSPSSQKIVKLVLEGNTLSNTTGAFDLADLSQNTVLYKSWGVAIATGATAGIITL